MNAADWTAKVDAGWGAIVARHAPPDDAPAIPPLPPGVRPLLLDILARCYPANAAQTRLGNAPDAAIAWQVQSCLDDYSDADARLDLIGEPT
jgi:hypothetical protein